jgi:hypothetical protein
MLARSAAFAACFVASVSGQAIAATTADINCWRGDEVAAVQLQTLQTALMVQALKCQDTLPAAVDGYNRFLGNKRGLLLNSRHVIEGHFVRGMGTMDGTVAATNFQTRLGNRTSSDSISPERCRQSGAYSRIAAAASDDDLLDLARQLAPADALDACPASVAPAALPGRMNVQVWHRRAPVPLTIPAPEPVAAPAPVLAADPAPSLQPAVAVVAPAPVAAPAAIVAPAAAVKPAAPAGKADQVAALQAAVAALNLVAASLATDAK